MKTISISPPLKPIKATVTIPGSKSFTNRALILSALSKDTVVIKNPLFSDDTVALLSCLEKLGVKIKQEKGQITVIGNVFENKQKEVILDADLSGTTMRFLLAVCCIIPGIKTITGKQRLIERPIKDLADALKDLDAKINFEKNQGFPPIKITSSKLTKNFVTISGKTSSQFVSALLMIAPIIGLTIKIDGELISKPYVAMTIQTLEQFGVDVENKNFQEFIIKRQPISAKEFIVEGDFSSGAYFAAIAAITKSEITLKNLREDSLQADKEFLSILEQMRSKIIFKKNEVTVIGNGVKPIIVNMQNCPDQIQTLAVMAAFTSGTTTITGASSLKVKETDRLQALHNELLKMNIENTITADSITIVGGNPKPATIDTYNDHRMAMSFSVAATKLPGIIINNPDVVNKTFPDFFKQLAKIGVKVEIKNKDASKIVLIGFMGAGKTSIAPLLAKRLRTNVLEMDEKVIKLSKQKSIKDIFEKYGEKKFRELEAKAAKKIVTQNPVVISAGGGVVENMETMKHLTKNACVVFLETSFGTISNRLVNTQDRPLWKNKEKTKKLFEKRQSLYKQYADVLIQTDGKSLGQITSEIEEKVKYL
ncbi:MAG TPA: 3-phosphoshikimate 1-carboxyvinyltransferase [Patescibacteria group bacterium]